MYLSVRKSAGVPYLYLIESVRVPGKKHPQKKIIKNYGRYDKLSDEVRKNYEDAKKRKLLERQLIAEHRAASLHNATVQMQKAPAETEKSSHFNRALTLCYGHLALKGIWENDLGLKYKINYLQNHQTEIKSWQLNDLLFYLCSLKIMDPGSYLNASETKSRFLYCPWNSVTQDNFYRALDFVYKHRDDLIERAVSCHHKNNQGEIKLAFFDCTNTWFETPYDDLTQQVIRFTRQVKQELSKEHFSEEQISRYLDSETFSQRLSDYLEAHQNEILRMRGPSKEGRFAQPLVSVALAIDQTGFPIDCQVFAGNVSEIHAVKPMVESLKKKYHVKDVYFVADRGLNSTGSLEEIRNQKLGFVVAESVSGQKASERKIMLDKQGWQNCTMNEDGTFVPSNDPLQEERFRFKVCDHVKCARVPLGTGELTSRGHQKKRKAEVNCQIVYTFSPERRARDLANLEEQIARASQAVKEGRLVGNPCKSGWRGLIRVQCEDTKDKEEREKYRACGLKQDVIEERRQTAGYGAIVWAAPQEQNESERQLSVMQVLSTYHKLVGIEQCFRIMKSTFSIRPVYVRLHQRIVAHCYLCVLSLMMLRALQEKLQAQSIHLSAQGISRALSEAMVVPIPGSNVETATFLNIGPGEQFHAARYTGKGKLQEGLNDMVDSVAAWKRFEADREAVAGDIDRILETVGLKPLNLCTSLKEIKRRLGLHTQPDSVMLAPEYVAFNNRAMAGKPE